jgi:hypothetical protein
LLPTLSRLSVSTRRACVSKLPDSGPADRLRHRCSSGSLRIPPLHPEFRLPLPCSKPDSRPRRPGVEPRAFTQALSRPPTRPLRPVIPDNARALRITAAAGTELAGASSPGTVNGRERPVSSRATVVYTPKGVLPHAASLRQDCSHCARFPTAASRRSLGRLSVPMWLAILSDQLPVIALVSRYPTNELIGREPL